MTSFRRRSAAALAALSTFVVSVSAAQAPAPRAKPALVVMLVVDQMRPDYFARFERQWTGGFGRLYRQGAFFAGGRQDHAITETAPGHSTVLSGREPTSTGIVDNERGVPDPEYPLIGVPDAGGASPMRFRGTELYDWMRAADSGAQVLSVSRKDRGAILPVGRGGHDVYWYTYGRFTTSRYYADTLPSWVTAYNARGGPARLAGHVWNLLLPDSAYAESDTFDFESGGRGPRFPHALSPDAAKAAAELIGQPWMDSLTLDFALEGVRQRQLGRRGHPDLLSVSLSTNDAIGHRYGPNSREIHDHLLRLDRWLGVFLDSLAVLVPGEIVVALTADHGVQEMPEYAALQGRPSGRASIDSIALDVGARLDARYAARFGVTVASGLIEADVSALRARGVDVDRLADSLATLARAQPGVAHVYTARTLKTAPASDVFAERWRRSIPPTTEWLIAAVPSPGYIWATPPGWATHGTPLPADVGVPIVFLGPGIRAGRYPDVVRTVDIGPTFAALLGVRPTEPLMGRPIARVVAHDSGAGKAAR